MEIVIHWVTQIVIFLIIAIMIDLMIPATSMKKYIKLVIGLILILLFLKPVFALFHMDVSGTVDTAFDDFMAQQPEDDTMKNSIKMQKNEIDNSKRAYILDEMAVQLKDSVNKRLAEDYHVKIRDLDFKFKSDAKPSYENLDKVIVYLRHIDEEEGAVDIVRDVDINTEKPTSNEQADKQETEDIKQLLHEKWEVATDQLMIEWKGGSS